MDENSAPEREKQEAQSSRNDQTIFQRNRENVYFRWGLTAVIVVMVCVIGNQLITKLPTFLSSVGAFIRSLAPVVYGLCVAYILNPIVRRLQELIQPLLEPRLKRKEKAGKYSRLISILLAIIIALLVIYAIIAKILPQLFASIVTIANMLPTYYDTISTWITNLIDDNVEMAAVTSDVMESVYSYLNNFLSDTLLPMLQNVLTDVTTGVVGMAKSLINLGIGIIISIYLMMDKEHFIAQARKACYAFLGRRKGEYVCNVCTYANQVFSAFIIGKLIDSLIIGILCFIGMSILKLPYTLLIAVIVGVTNIIPFFGPYIGAVPSAIFLLVESPVYCLTFVIFILALQAFDGNILGPKILGNATGLSSFWVIVAILLFGNLFGVLGMIIGVPLLAVVYKIISEEIDYLLVKRDLSETTSDYLDPEYPPSSTAPRWSDSKLQRRPSLIAQTADLAKRCSAKIKSLKNPHQEDDPSDK